MHHRSGLLKQSNKGHATLGHKSKRSVDNVNRGRVGLKDQVGKRNKSLESRKERRNKSRQVRDVKKTAVLDAKRNLGENKGLFLDIFRVFFWFPPKPR